jgi:hypothetical protein
LVKFRGGVRAEGQLKFPRKHFFGNFFAIIFDELPINLTKLPLSLRNYKDCNSSKIMAKKGVFKHSYWQK